MVSLTAGDQRRAHPLQGEVAGAHHHIRLCEDSAQRLLCRVQEELCLRAVEGGGLPYPASRLSSSAGVTFRFLRLSGVRMTQRWETDRP